MITKILCDHTVRIWNIDDGTKEAILQGNTRIVSVAIVLDNQYIVIGSDDRTLRVWSLRDRMQECTIHAHTNSITKFGVISDDKYVISGSQAMTVRV